MRTLNDFIGLIEAESVFEFFDVPYDRRSLRLAGRFVLRRFSVEVEEIERRCPELDDDERVEVYREALRRAYAPFERTAAMSDAAGEPA